MQRDLAYLADILQASRLALRFVEGMTYDQFAQDEKTQAAVIREFEIIGEAAGRVSTVFVVGHPDIPWRQMISMRNRMIHGYNAIDLEIVWDALHLNLPDLTQRIAPLVPPEDES